MSMQRRLRLGIHLALAATLAGSALAIGCSSGLGGVEPGTDEVTIEVAGRLERGLRVHFGLSGNPAPGSEAIGAAVSWSAEPAAAVEFFGDGGADRGEARLLRAGAVTITARAGERVGRLTIEVAAPPTVVFESVRDGNRDIYRVALDGSELARLTSGQHDNRSPTVASGRVVFVSYRTGNGELYTVPLAGGAEVRLTHTTAHEADPALSPDGRRLAYTSADTGVPKLWTAAHDAGGAARATTGFGYAGALEAAPSWAPDGGRLVFVSTTRGTADLFLLTLATGSVTPLLATDAPEVEPAWSPDGKWIAFTFARAGATGIYRMRLGTGEVEQLTDPSETATSPAWLSDGRIAYIASVDGAPRLRWLDPADPATTHEVPLGEGTVGRVSAVW